MKICDVVQFYSPLSGGIKNYIHSKAIWFAENRPDIEHLVIVPGHRREEFTIGNSKFYSIKSPKLPLSKSYRVLCSKRHIKRLIEHEKPDIIETGDPYITAKICNSIAKEYEISTVAFYHSDFPRTIPPHFKRAAGQKISSFIEKKTLNYLRNLYSQNDALVVASSTMAGQLAAVGLQNIVNIPLGIDTKLYVPTKPKTHTIEKYGISVSKKNILFVGRFCFEKNIISLVHAFKMLRGKREDIQLVLIGDGEYKKKILNITEGCPDVVILPYLRDKAELIELYTHADVFVHPGVLETFGYVMLEAQSCGTKVVAVQGSVTSEVCTHCKDNVMSENEFPDALAEAIEQSLMVEDSWEKHLKRHQAIAERFSHNNTYSRLSDLYSSIVEKSHKSSGF